ncbi:hypothetical protein ACB092_05G033700 [Castanea dentata]
MQEEDVIMELYNASMSGCTTTLHRLIHKEPNILNKISLTSMSETPLHISTLVGHLDFSRALLLLKPQLAIELDSHKRCPLHMASAEGHIEIVQLLLRANNNACLIRDQDERIPLHYAVMRGRIDVVRELITAQPDSSQIVLDGGETVLHICVKYNQIEALKLLVESLSDEGDFLNSKDHDGGNTILHLAVMLKQTKIVKYLLSVSKVKDGAYSLNQMGFTALEVFDHCPEDLKNVTIRNILLDAGIERARNQTNLQPPLTVVIGHNEPVQPSKNWWLKWIEYLSYQGDWLGEMRGTLMVVATVITTITFQPILNPPGGVSQTNKTLSVESYGNRHSIITCPAGTSVLACNADQYFRYSIFLISNTISFTASLCVTFLLISGFPLRNKLCMGLLTFSMCITLTFLAFAYIYAFILLLPDQPYFYDTYRTEPMFILIMCVLLSLMAVVGIVLLIHTIRFLTWMVVKIRKLTLYMQRR